MLHPISYNGVGEDINYRLSLLHLSKFGNIAQDQSLLIQGLINRDEAALRELYNVYGAALNGVILRIVEDEVIAAEALQDVIMKVWQKIEIYDPSKGRLFTWMMQLARNTARDKFKTKEYSQKVKTDQIDQIVPIVERRNPVESYIEDIGVRKLIDSLREEERQVIYLVYFKGYTQAEAAKKIPIPLGTVKTRLRMALKNLKKVMDK